MAEPTPLTGLQTSGSVSSRFVSQNELDEAKKRKDEEWKAAYARLGQEPPPQEEEAEYDPRSLYERLSVQKETKKEEWDEKMRMANQFRGLEADELQFLDETAQKERERQRKVERQDAEELAAFKRLQNKQGAMTSPPIEVDQRTAPSLAPPLTSQPSGAKPPPSSAPSKRNVKSLLKGVIKKKDTKPKEPASMDPLPTAPHPPSSSVKPPVSASSTAPAEDEKNSKKRAAPAPALGGLGDYDSDSDASDGPGEPEAKKLKV